MGKHFDYSITEDGLTFSRKEESIQREADLDGFYIVRTSVPEQALNAAETVAAYKSLAVVERAFRCLKTVDLSIRPIYHRLARRVRAHVFLCMLAYYVEWHMRQVLKPLLFEDEDRLVANAERSSLVINAQRSDGAKAKDATKRTVDGLPVQSFQALLAHLATMAQCGSVKGCGLAQAVTEAGDPDLE
jgi:Transposase DDE domain